MINFNKSTNFTLKVKSENSNIKVYGVKKKRKLSV